MQWIKDFELFLFDFDGLLVNTEWLHFKAYINMCKGRGYALKWDFHRFCLAAHFESTGLRDAIYAEFPALQKEEPRWEILYAEKKKAYLEVMKSGELQLMPGVAPLLQALEKENTRRCVVTNSPLEQIEYIKQQLPLLQTIPLWVTREKYTKAKPDPESYLKAIDLLGQPGDRMIGFEDSTRGVRALLGAKIQPILVCPKDHPQLANEELQNVLHFPSFENMPDQLTGYLTSTKKRP